MDPIGWTTGGAHGLTHTLTIEESDRQLLVMGLAELAIARPGWVDACLRAAANRIDPEAKMLRELLRLRDVETEGLGGGA